MDGRAVVLEGGSLFAVAIVYFVTARAGLLLATVGHSVTLVWPPTGLALAMLFTHGRRLWPAIALGAFAANATTPGVPLIAAATIALGNTGEALIGTELLRRSGFEPSLRRVSDVLRLLLLGCAVGPIASALVGASTLSSFEIIPEGAWWTAARQWWVGDFMGAMLVSPLLFTARGMIVGQPRPPWHRWLEGAAVAVSVMAVSLVAFNRPPGTQNAGFVVPRMIFPFLLWAALRFGPRGAAWANFAVAGVSVWATVNYLGPFARLSLADSLLIVQMFLLMVVLMSLFIGASAAERADAIQAREDFISIASHELRTPLTPLTLQIDRLRRLTARGEPTARELSSLHASLERQAMRLSGLVEILLDLTRLRTGQMSLNCERFDLIPLVRDTLDTVTAHARVDRSLVTLDAPATIEGTWDRLRIQQAITNLVSNALRYGEGKPVAVSVIAERNHVRIVVKDRGPGIAKRDQRRLFKRFERLPGALSRSGGLGLGLFITRQIIEAHGGTVYVESRPGTGATFTCALPLGADDARSAQA